KIGHDVALDGGLQQRPLEPACIARMHAGEPAVGSKAHAHEHIAAEGLDKCGTHASGERGRLTADRARFHTVEQCADDLEAFTDLVHTHHQPTIDVACASGHHIERSSGIGLVYKSLARVEGAA